ncbi:PSD1 and planctomycete cytochrome C domain-containing protein [Candidatus Laterigemmans baculatus]|uniref:PSD1 and planctomycete cytochrome C domain-containing protein n=1 Tax=Candidatus Laterigemmans baculatus TaxID=2770505 RepID=UPI001F3E99AA|nr:PSD1 and planctomycete cytochrome C domain-containing protein [Candidatus Laterigemmans baculatus]
MTLRMFLILATLLGAARLEPLAGRAGAAEAIAADRQEEAFFESRVRPLLVEHCYDCHSLELGDSSGDLRLDDAAATRRGGSRGPAVVPGDEQQSLLLTAVKYDSPDLQMPPEGKLADEEIEVLRQWIASGAYDPREPLEHEPEDAEPAADPREHWAFQLPERTPPPQVVADSARDVLDAVVAERLTEHQLAPAEPADRRTLVRRLTYDLTGLPPSEAAVERFVASERPDAYARLVDSLLASPEFGERWARHWMDVARYADTIGYTLAGRERRLRGSERYRDWLIRHYNGDLPYDEMIRYQLAADRLDPEGEQGHLDAMGFLTIGRRFLSKHDTIDDRIDVVTRGLLGLTVACARCHDHKFDPVPTTDYYALYGVFNSSQTEEGDDSPWPLRMTDIEKPQDVRVFVRGQAGNRGPVAPRQFVSILEDATPEPFTTGSGRFDLAMRIADPANPLTARVYVNRVWGHLLGRPLVDTPSDFGVRTERPAHPELLDDLAAEFVAQGYSTKWLVRRIVLTHLYQQRSRASERQMQADPENRLLARGNRRRLGFEALRDSTLVVSGHLQRTLGGEPVKITEASTPPRRTVYAFIDRQQLPGVFRVFDLASPDAHTPERHATTVPQQALYLMNSPFALQAARDSAAAVERELAASATDNSPPSGSADDAERFVEALYRRVLRRSPSDRERSLAEAFVREPADDFEPVDYQSAWQYGIATLDEQGTVSEFQPFPHFSENRYAGGEKFPHPEWGYASLTSRGGHPGGGRKRAVVRRWIAPRGGRVEVSASVNHPNPKGDGVRATLVLGEAVLWSGVAHENRQSSGSLQVDVAAGQPLDLVVDDNGTTSFDGFSSELAIRLDVEQTSYAFHSQDDFRGPGDRRGPKPGLNRREQLAQALLMSNEFAFVD